MDQHDEVKKAEVFMNKIIQVCKEHGLIISHEDIGGAFLLEKYSTDGEEWLRGAVENYEYDLNKGVSK